MNTIARDAPGATERPRTGRNRPARRNRRRTAGPIGSIDRILLVAAVIGLLVSAYLAIADLTGASTLCLQGSDCDAVRGSTFGKVLGVPLAVFEVAYFGAVLGLALIRHPRAALLLQGAGGLGLAAGVLFLGLQGLVLRAWCPYCLLADLAALVIAGRTLLPIRGPSLVRGAAGAAIAAAILLGGYLLTPNPSAQQSSDELTQLADHLRESGAVFYGAYWCPHCQNQKRMFGSAASRLPYVECDPRGTGARPDLCQAAGVQAYPTWVINGEKLEGELSIAELQRLSGFWPDSRGGEHTSSVWPDHFRS